MDEEPGRGGLGLSCEGWRMAAPTAAHAAAQPAPGAQPPPPLSLSLSLGHAAALTAQHLGAAVVSQRARQDLAGARAILVDQHYERHVRGGHAGLLQAHHLRRGV